MTNEILSLLLAGSFITFLFIGFPVAIALAVAGLIVGYLGFGTTLFSLVPARIYGVLTNNTLMAVPLFVFMGLMLERSKITENLLDVIGHAFGKVNGGMGLAVILVGVLMGASTGIVGATVVTLGLLTLPTFLRRNYHPAVACGTICASGTLGQIIPPSLVLILLADIMGLSVGTLFAAALVPGLALSLIYMVAMLVLGLVKPSLVPAIPAKERALMSTRRLVIDLIRVVLPPLLLVFAVLGSIIAGIAAPTEAAGVGAIGSAVIVLASGRMNISVLRETMQGTLKISAMVFLILICSQFFSLAFRGVHGEDIIDDMFSLLPSGIGTKVIFMLFMLFIFGFFLEWIEISYIILPMFLPILKVANVDMVWVSILVCMVLQTSFLTPPVGWALFFLKGVTPPNVSTRDIYVGVLPFVVLQVVALGLIFLFPEVVTWLPSVIGW